MEEGEGGTPCSGFCFVPFPLQLTKTSLATPQPRAISERMVPKGGRSGDGETVMPEDSPQPHLRLPLPSITRCGVHGQHTWAQAGEIGTSYSPSAPSRADLLSRYAGLR